MGKAATGLRGTQAFWLWVTRREYYQDESGSDADFLNPRVGVDNGGYWTCQKDTTRGDLALLWRTRPKSDIGYLIQARSDAYDISSQRQAAQKGWSYACDYKPIFMFENPLTISDIKNDPFLEDWSALRKGFQGKVFKCSPVIWQRVNSILMDRNSRYKIALARVSGALSPRIHAEEKIENWLVQNLRALRPLGYDLELWYDAHQEISGRQFVCRGHGGRIDLLCIDRKRGSLVVVELKNVRAGRETFGQISSYMGWVKRELEKRRKPVRGLVISRGYDTYFGSAMDSNPRVRHIELSQLGFR